MDMYDGGFNSLFKFSEHSALFSMYLRATRPPEPLETNIAKMRSLFLAAALLPQLLNAISLWDPKGPYHVGYTQHVFNHSTPVDPTPNPGILLLTIYYPTLQALNTTVPYLDATLARVFEQTFGVSNGTLSKLTTTLQPEAPTLLGTHPAFGNGTSPYPTLIFTPGAGAPAAIYTAYLSELASHGFSVVAIDHPGEAPYTALPDGAPGVPGLPPLLANVTATALHQLVLNRVPDIEATMGPAGLPALVAARGAPFNTTHFGVFGHSAGGSAAAGVMLPSSSSDAPRFRAGVNVDGTFQHLTKVNANKTAIVPDPDAPSPDLCAPFLEIGSEARFLGVEDADATWGWFNANQSGWLRDVQVNGTTHLDYSDLPLCVDLLGERGGAAGTQVGSIAGRRLTEVVTGLLVRFFGEMVGGGRGVGSVDSFIKRTPEVFVMAESG